MIKHQLKSYLHYWLYAVDHHSLHSPFLFDFYTSVIRPKPDRQQFADIEQIRQQYLEEVKAINLLGLGAGSKHFTENKREIKSIAKTSVSPQKYAILYWAITHYFNARTILELGTSIGINTAYIAKKRLPGIHF